MEVEQNKLTDTQYFGVLLISWIMIIGGKLLSMISEPLFKHVNYGQMTVFFTEIVNCCIWIVCIIALYFFIKKKCAVNILSNPLTRKQELENKNLIAVIGIIIVCILIISAQIGFQVKPFYDMGVKITGYELMGKLGGILSGIIKCVWMIILIECAQNICESRGLNPRVPWGGIVLMCTMGVYDIVFGLTTLVITYFVLNIVYGVIFLLTHKSVSKSYLGILLIYIF